MTNQEAKQAWADGKKLEYRLVNWGEGEWAGLTGSNSIGIFDRYDVHFRIVQEPVVLECVVDNGYGGKVLYCGEKFVARCSHIGIDPPLGATVKVTVEVE